MSEYELTVEQAAKINAMIYQADREVEVRYRLGDLFRQYGQTIPPDSFNALHELIMKAIEDDKKGELVPGRRFFPIEKILRTFEEGVGTADGP